MEKDAKDLAHKMLDLCEEHNTFDVLDAIYNLHEAIIETHIVNPTAKVLVYAEYINYLNERVMDISSNALSELN